MVSLMPSGSVSFQSLHEGIWQRHPLQLPGLDVYMKEHVHLRNKHRQKKDGLSKIVPTLRQGGFIYSCYYYYCFYYHNYH